MIRDKISGLCAAKEKTGEELIFVKGFMAKYYSDSQLRNEYRERIDEGLLRPFKEGGCLYSYCSNRVALHNSTYTTILDYMRDLDWE